eukprot:Skav218214  [mRNA]  locus=scaffold1375:68303:69247:- [translate_table: standard]
MRRQEQCDAFNLTASSEEKCGLAASGVYVNDTGLEIKVSVSGEPNRAMGTWGAAGLEVWTRDAEAAE